MTKRTKCNQNPLYPYSKWTRGRKSRLYYELMEKYTQEGNEKMIEYLKVNGTKGLDAKKK